MRLLISRVVTACLVVVAVGMISVSSSTADPACTKSWVGPSSGNWATSSNWSGGTLPAAGAVVCVPADTAVVVDSNTSAVVATVLGASASLDLRSSGSLSVTSTSAPSSLRDLTISGGSLSGAGVVNVSGAFSWTAGTMLDVGSTVLAAGATGVISPAVSVALNQRTLVNNGTLTWSAGTIQGSHGGVLQNTGTFVANSESTNGFQYYTGGGFGGGVTINNTGTFTKTAGSGNSFIGVPVNNLASGSVVAQSGVMDFAGGGTANQQSAGAWNASSGGLIKWDGGSYLFGPGSQLSGSVEVASGSVTMTGVQGPSASVVVSGSSAALTITDPGQPTSIRDLAVSAGTVNGTGVLNLSGSLAWSGGTMAGTGSTVLGSGATGTINPSAAVTLDQRTLSNQGVLTFASGTLRGSHSAVMQNTGTFVVNSESTNGFQYYTGGGFGGGASILNSGTIKKATGTGTSIFTVPVTNTGTITAQTGTVFLAAGTIASQASTGNFSASTGARLQMAGTSSLVGASLQGAVEFSSGVISATGLQATGASVTVSGATTFNVNDPATPSFVGDLTFTAGTMGGSGPLFVTKTFAWVSGLMNGTGKTVISDQATGTITPTTSVTLNQRVLVNRGTLTWSSGALQGTNAATLDNSGTFKANSENASGMSNGGSPTPGLINSGRILKTAGTGTTRIYWALADNGTTTAGSGTISQLGPIIAVGAAGSARFGLDPHAAPNVRSCHVAKPVDCSSGNQTEVQGDLVVGGQGLGLEAVRTYNSQAAAAATAPGVYGYGWSGSYSDRLTISAYRTVTVVQSDGSTALFTDYGAGNYQAAPWVQATLVKNADGSFTYTLPSLVSYRFDAGGRLLSQSDRNGNTTTMAYDGSGRLSSVSDPSGRSLTYGYTAGGQVASITDPTGLEVDYTYAGGNLTGVKYAGVSNTQWGFGYDAAHQLTSMVDARGMTTSTVYDSSHRVTSQTDALNRTRTWSYSGDTTTITNPGGDITKETFADGEPLTIIHALGTGAESTQTLTYDSARALITSTDGEGRQTSYTYDTVGNRTSITTPGAHTTSLTYNTARDVTSVSSPSGKLVTFTYDTHGNLLSRTATLHAPGQSDVDQASTYSYDTAGNLLTASDPLHHQTSYAYNPRGDLLSVTDPLGNITSYTYDDDSRTTAITSPRGHVAGNAPADYTTLIQRDSRGQVTSTTDGLGHQSFTSYDEIGDPLTTTDAVGNTTSYTYDAENQLTAVTAPGGTSTHTAYDPDGQIASTTDEAGHSTVYHRDAASQITAIDDPLSRSTSYTYDHSGRQSTSTDAQGRTASYTYTAAGLLASIDYQDPGTPDVSYSYDSDGQRTAMSDGTGTTSYTHDSLGRLTSVTDGNDETVSYTYDLADRQTTITYPTSGHTLTRGYDAGDQLVSQTDWNANTTSFAHDADGNTTTITYPQATSDSDQWSYDPAGRVTGIALTHNSTLRASYAYTYTANDQLASETGTGELTASHAYTYDPRSRLSTQDSTGFGYDTTNNPASLAGTTQQFDAANQLTSSGTTTYTFDQNGNRTATTPATGPATAYTYGQADQLTSVDDGTSTPIGYTYDADGLRASKTKNASTTHFTWDRSTSLPLLLTKDTTSYIYDDQGLPLEQIDADGTTTYLHHDRLGSTRLTTTSDGTTQATYDYTPYGTRTTTTGTTDTPFGYTGQYTETDTGLIYLRTRYYDPTTAQFLTVDPLEAATNDAYGYASQDPANAIDPSGLSAFSAIGSAARAIASTAKRGAQGALGEADGVVQTLTLGHATASGILGIDTDCLGSSYQIGHGFGTVAAYAIPLDRLVRFAASAARAAKAGSELPALAGGARTIEEIVQPGGQLIGNAGSSTAIREVQGGQAEAEQLFNELANGATDVTPAGHTGQLVRLPNGGHIGYRAASKSGPPTIDINVPGIAVRKIKFVP